MLGSHTTEDGFTLTVFGTLYTDYGLEIRSAKSGDQLYYSPCCLSNESYGRKPHPRFDDDYDEAEQAELGGDINAFVLWEEADWVECLKEEADQFIEAYLGPEATP